MYVDTTFLMEVMDAAKAGAITGAVGALVLVVILVVLTLLVQKYSPK